MCALNECNTSSNHQLLCEFLFFLDPNSNIKFLILLKVKDKSKDKGISYINIQFFYENIFNLLK